MAGKPKQNADIAALDLSGKGDEALALLAQGVLLKKICERLGVGRYALLEWMRQGDAERAARVGYARRSGAAAMVEEAHEIADGMQPLIDPETLELRPPDPSRDKLRVQVRQWTAERLDRDTWGQQQNQVTVNLNGLHLDALRAPSVAHTRTRAQPADVVELEQIEQL
jgi:transposase